MPVSNVVTLGSNVNLASAAAQTAVTLRDTPVLPYRTALITVAPSGATGTTTMLIEGSENGGSSYSTLATVTIAAASPVQMTTVKAYPLTRVRISSAGSAGTANVYMEPT